LSLAIEKTAPVSQLDAALAALKTVLTMEKGYK